MQLDEAALLGSFLDRHSLVQKERLHSGVPGKKCPPFDKPEHPMFYPRLPSCSRQEITESGTTPRPRIRSL